MIKELLKKGFKITNSEARLRGMLEEFEASNNFSAFKTLKIQKNDKPFDVDDFVAQLGSTFKDLGSFDEIIRGVIEDKATKKDKETTKRLEKAAQMDRGTRLEDKKDVVYEKIELFSQTPTLKANELDYKFFENFKIIKGGLLYRDSKNTVHRIFINSKGGIDIKGELFSYGDDSLYIEMKKDIEVKYDQWCKTANVGWNKMSEDDRLEDVFDIGFKHDEDVYAIPTIMRYFIVPRAKYVMLQSDKGGRSPVFSNFEAVSKNGSMLFDDQLDLLSQNWNRWTKGLISPIENWKAFSNDANDWALNHYVINKNWESAKMPEKWAWFFKGMATDRILMRLFFYVGACLDANNTAQQALLIADIGGTGKGTFMALLRDMLGNELVGSVTNECFENPRFAVFAHGLYNHHILINTEYDGHSCNSELFKQLVGGDTITCEIKNGDSFEFDARGTKLILSSNKVCYMKEHAIRRRLIPLAFKANDVIKNGLSEKDRIELLMSKEKFLTYCYKVYKKCPFRDAYGGYMVMNPHQEDVYLKTKQLPEDREKFLMKAFSEDPDIGERFKCGDPTTETHLNDDFEQVYDELFVYADKADDVIPVSEFKKTIEDFVLKDKDNKIAFFDSFEWTIIPGDTVYHLGSMKSQLNKQFLAYLEKTKGHTYNKVCRINNKTVRCITNIKKKTRSESADAAANKCLE